MWTPPFRRLVAPARRRPGLPRLLASMALVAALWFAAVLGVLGLAAAVAGPEDGAAWQARIAAGETPTGVLLLLATFGGLAGGGALALRLLHGRTAASLLGPAPARRFAGAAILCLLVSGAAGLALAAPVPLVPGTPLGLFLSFLPCALVALALQTGAEELVFRGLLQTQLAARFASPLVWMGLPSVLFGLLHWSPEAGANAPLVVLVTALFGLLAADLTRVTGGIAAAWGLHFANNALAVLVVSLDGPLSGLALWRLPFGAEAEGLPLLLAQDALLMAIVWAVIRLWLARDPAQQAATDEDAPSPDGA